MKQLELNVEEKKLEIKRNFLGNERVFLNDKMAKRKTNSFRNNS